MESHWRVAWLVRAVRQGSDRSYCFMSQSGVYILQNNRNGRYYIGHTSDLGRRLKEHNSGKVKATRHLAPWELRVFIKCENPTEARMAEYKLKKYKRRDILERVIENKTFPWNHTGA